MLTWGGTQSLKINEVSIQLKLKPREQEIIMIGTKINEVENKGRLEKRKKPNFFLHKI